MLSPLYLISNYFRRFLPVISLLIAFNAAAFSQAGSLDYSFNSQGYVRTGIGRSSDTANATAIQSDGKIIVVGQGASDFSVVRYNVDGSLDATFGTGGEVLTAIRSFQNVARDVVIQPDGKIVVAGTGSYRVFSRYSWTPRSAFALARYNSNGTLDRTFGIDGRVSTTIGTGLDEAYGLTLQSDGRIIVVGTGNESVIEVARYNTDGSLDASFDSDGKLTTPIGVNSQARAVTVQGDGQILVTGSSSIGVTEDYTTVRYNPDGSLDTTFNGTGISRIVDNTGVDRANNVVVQPDGKILIGGSPAAFVVARLNADGTLDTSFDGEGVLTPYNLLGPITILLQPDGKIVVVGGGLQILKKGILALRFNADGSPDTSFGADGRASVFFKQGDVVASTAALQPDGKLVATGYSFDSYGSPADIVVTRYNVDGSLDTTLGVEGRVTTNVGTRNCTAQAVVVQPDGKIINVGSTYGGASGQDLALIRYNPAGTLDGTFGTDGIVVTPTGPQDEQANGAALQSDGKILVTGRSIVGSRMYFLVVRYMPDGSLDATFGTGGKVSTPVGGNSDSALAVAIQGDGKIVVVGESLNDTYSLRQSAIARYNIDGSLDTTFDGDGIRLLAVGTSTYVNAVVIQPDGKIVASGTTTGAVPSSSSSTLIVRFNADGSSDITFNGTGILVTQLLPGGSFGGALALQKDGKIVIAGSARNAQNVSTAIAVSRFNTDGTADLSFNGVGTSVSDVTGGEDWGEGISVQPDGKILVVGQVGYDGMDEGESTDFGVLRYNPDGTLDLSWGASGTAVTDLIGGDFAYAMTTDAQGNVLVSGQSRGKMTVARYIGGSGAAAAYSLSGRAITPKGQGIAGVRVSLTGTNGEVRSAMTSSFGYYSFEGLGGGAEYTLSIEPRRYQFDPRVVTLTHDLSDIDLVAH